MENQNTTRWDDRLTSVVPSRRQLAHQEMEFYAFFHYTINTYTGREWGGRNRIPLSFCPVAAGSGTVGQGCKGSRDEGSHFNL